MLQEGDIVLTKQIKGFTLISDIIGWRQNSKIASHVGVVVDPKTPTIFDARMFKKSRIINMDYFFNGKFSISILRYSPDLSGKQKADVVGYLKRKVGVKYDNESIVSIIINDDDEDSSKLNCAESTLLAYNNAGLLTKRTVSCILPHSFWEYYMADRFVSVAEFHKPTKKDLMEFLNG